MARVIWIGANCEWKHKSFNVSLCVFWYDHFQDLCCWWDNVNQIDHCTASITFTLLSSMLQSLFSHFISIQLHTFIQYIDAPCERCFYYFSRTVIRIPISIKLPLSFRKNCSTNGIFLLYHLLIDGVPRRLFFVHLSLMCCCWRAADCVSVFVLLQRAYRRSHTFIDDPNQMFFFFKYFDYFMAQRK